MNTVEVCGWFVQKLYKHHETHGEKMFAGSIAVPRLSGVNDIVSVTVPSRLYGLVSGLQDGLVWLKGELRSYNKSFNGKNQLRLTLYVQEADAALDCTQNDVQISGFVCKKPEYRITPFGREVCDVMIAVHLQHGKSAYIPSIAWGRNAKLLSLYHTGDPIAVSGRIQSREYQKVLDNGETITRTVQEVSIFKLDVEVKADE